jgi:hypothetical protein
MTIMRSCLRLKFVALIVHVYIFFGSCAKTEVKDDKFAVCDSSTSNSRRKILGQQHLDAGKVSIEIGSKAADSKALKHFQASVQCFEGMNTKAFAEASQLLQMALHRSGSARPDKLPRTNIAAAAAAKQKAAAAEADAEFQAAVRLSGEGDTAGAARGFARAVALQPSNALAWSNLGVVRQQVHFPSTGCRWQDPTNGNGHWCNRW